MKVADRPSSLIAALQAWGIAHKEPCRAISTGLINETYAVEDRGKKLILQRVHPVFAPEIHLNIRAVSEHLHAQGLQSPQLVARPDGSGDCFKDEENRIWRLQSFIPGKTLEGMESPTQTRAAAAFLARWHEALDSLEHEFLGIRAGVHDTPAHLQRLREALAEHRGHRLFAPVEPVAEQLFALIEGLDPLLDLQLKVAHGDPKIANLRFDAAGEHPQAWVDLDTVGPMNFGHELGDALRSWCNPCREDGQHSAADLQHYRAAVSGYLQGRSDRRQIAEQRAGLLWGPCWISAELALRFAADALNENYFGYDRTRYPAAGEHNLARARSQLALAQSFVDSLYERARILEEI